MRVYILGGLFLFAGLFATVRELHTILKGVKAEAIIIDVERERLMRTLRCTPTIKYKVDGKNYKATVHTSVSAASTWIKGDKVQIYYKKDDPEKVVIQQGKLPFFLFMALLVAFGTVLILMEAGLL